MCLFGKSDEQYLSQCSDIVRCSQEEVKQDACTLKKACSECQEINLRVLHTIAYLIIPKECISLANSKQGGKVYLKVVPVIISHGSKSLHTYAILDEEAEHTITLPGAIQHLELKGKPESLALQMICQDVARLTDASVDFHIPDAAFKPTPD